MIGELIDQFIAYFIAGYIFNTWLIIILRYIFDFISHFFVTIPSLPRPKLLIIEHESNLDYWEEQFINNYEKQEAISKLEEVEIVKSNSNNNSKQLNYIDYELVESA